MRGRVKILGKLAGQDFDGYEDFLFYFEFAKFPKINSRSFFKIYSRNFPDFNSRNFSGNLLQELSMIF